MCKFDAFSGLHESCTSTRLVHSKATVINQTTYRILEDSESKSPRQVMRLKRQRVPVDTNSSLVDTMQRQDKWTHTLPDDQSGQPAAYARASRDTSEGASRDVADQHSKVQGTTEPPQISVLVPVFNESERLRDNLDAILEQKDVPSFEVIYIDNNSTDDGCVLLRQFSKEHPNVRAFHLEMRTTVGTVRRLGVQLARADIIANLDSDCVPPVHWLAQYRRLSGNVGIIGFPVVPPNDLEYLHHKFQYVGSGQYPEGSLPHGCGAIMNKDLVVKAGNFQDKRIGEDTALFQALRENGGAIVLLDSPSILLLDKRTTLKDHLARYFQMGRYAGNKSRAIYALMLTMLALDVFAMIEISSANPSLSAILALAWIGVMTNPKRVIYYTRNFVLPKTRLSKFLCFGAIKFLETGAILAGFICTLASIREASRRGPATPRAVKL